MSTSFPTSLDSFTNPTGTDILGNASPALVHSTQHANINDSVAALETKLGVDGSAVATSIDYLLKNASSSNPGHKHTYASLTGMMRQPYSAASAPGVTNDGVDTAALGRAFSIGDQWLDTATNTLYTAYAVTTGAAVWRASTSLGSIITGTPTQGGLLFSGAAGALAQDPTVLFWDETNNYLGVGHAVPAQPIHVVDNRVTPTATSGIKVERTVTLTTATYELYGIQAIILADVGSTAAFYYIGHQGRVNGRVQATFSNNGYFTGCDFTVQRGRNGASDDGTLADLRGVNVTLGHSATAGSITSGVTTSVEGFQTRVVCNAGTIGTYYGFRDTVVSTGGTITTYYGLHLGNTTIGTTKWGVYQVDTGSGNYFGGQVAIGSTTLAGRLQIAAPTASLSQIRLTASAGVDVGSPVTGDLWWNGTNLYFYNGATNKDLLAAASGGMSIGGAITSATAGSILFANASAQLGQDNANLFWDDANNRLGLGIAVPTMQFTQLKAGITAAPTDGMLLTNTTAASAGVQQLSPGLFLHGSGWKTTGTASVTVDYRFHVLPVQGAANPTAALLLQSSIAGAAYAGIFAFHSGGSLQFGGTDTTAGGRIAGSSGQLQLIANSTYIIGNAGSTTMTLDASNGRIHIGDNSAPKMRLSVSSGGSSADGSSIGFVDSSNTVIAKMYLASASFNMITFSGAMNTIGNAGVGVTSFATSLAKGLQIGGSTAPSADPSSSFAIWADTGQFCYRTSAASEGAGQTNRVHNRTETVVGAGTAYSLTGSSAAVDFGTTDPSIALPTAGTYLLIAELHLTSNVGGDEIHFKFRNTTDSSDVGSDRHLDAPVAGGHVLATMAETVTITATKTVALYAYNATAARGTVEAATTNIRYVRLS